MLLHTDERRAAVSEPIDEGAQAIGDSAQALIREARRRTLRRRGRRGSMLAAGLGLVLLAVVLLTRGGDGVIAGTASRPFVNVKAFSGQGNLAFISRGRLWVLDGAAGTARELPTPPGNVPADPSFSHDGRWLAYVVESDNENSSAPLQLWLARANGSGAHQVRDLAVNQLVGWSPRSDLVAVTVGSSTHMPYGSPTALDLVSPEAELTKLFGLSSVASRGVGAIWNVVWSPHGSALALSTYGPAGTTIRTIPVARPGAATVWLSIRLDQRLPVAGLTGRRPTEVIAGLAGWWSGSGLAFWIFDDGMVHNNDSTPLALLAKPGAQPKLLTQTLSDGLTDAVAAGPGGRLALVASALGAGREYGAGKTVERCEPDARTCVPLPGASVWTGVDAQTCRPCLATPAAGRPGSGVSLDPSWSPDGDLLAYVKAPAAKTGGWPSGLWYQDQALYVWNAGTGTSTRVAGVEGASLPTWSGDGRELLYVRSDGLWMTSLASGKPVEIEYPLYPPSEWHPDGVVGYSGNVAYYGQVPWSQQFSWSSAR